MGRIRAFPSGPDKISGKIKMVADQCLTRQRASKETEPYKQGPQNVDVVVQLWYEISKSGA